MDTDPELIDVAIEEDDADEAGGRRLEGRLI